MTTMIIERKNQFEIKQTALESAITELSAIFKEYKDIYSSSVVITGVDMNVYRLTTENVKLKIPSGMTTLLVRAATGPMTALSSKICSCLWKKRLRIYLLWKN